MICIGFQDSISQDLGTIIIINPNTLEIVHEYRGLGKFPWPVMCLSNYIWVVYQESNNAVVFRASDGQLVRRFGLGNAPSRLVFNGQDEVWLSNTDDGTIQRIQLTGAANGLNLAPTIPSAPADTSMQRSSEQGNS